MSNDKEQLIHTSWQIENPRITASDWETVLLAMKHIRIEQALKVPYLYRYYEETIIFKLSQ